MKLVFSLQMRVWGKFLDVSLRRLPSPALIVALHPTEPPVKNVVEDNDQSASVVLLKGAVASNYKILAIKAVRNITNTSLIDAKTAIDDTETSDVDLGKRFEKAWTLQDAKNIRDALVRDGGFVQGHVKVTHGDGSVLAEEVMKIVEEGEGGHCGRCDQARALISANRLLGV